MNNKLGFLGHLIAEKDGIQLYVKSKKGEYGLPDYYVFETIDSKHPAIICYYRHFSTFREGLTACSPIMTREAFYKNTHYEDLV